MNHFGRRSWIKQSMLMGMAAIGTHEYPSIYPNSRDQASGIIPLHSTENPIGFSDKIGPAVQGAVLNLHQEDHSRRKKLINAIAKKEAVKPHQIFLASGIREILGMAAFLYGRDGKEVLCSANSYDYLPLLARKHGGQIRQIPLLGNKKINLEQLQSANSSNTGVTYICNPNNPTGQFYTVDQLKSACTQLSLYSKVLIDEAYIEYTPKGVKASMAKFACSQANVIVLRTFSKIYGLMGMRIGYAIGHEESIAELADLHDGQFYNNSYLSIVAAMAALSDTAFLSKTKGLMRPAQDFLKLQFKIWDVDCYHSDTHFMLFSLANFEPAFIKKMKAKNIHLQGVNINGTAHCRISLHKMDYMRKFIEAAEKLKVF